MNKDMDDLRRDVGKFLDDLVDEDGFSPRLIATHTGINYRRIYRWLSSDIFLPPFKECRAIIDLAKKVERVKSDYADIVTSWNDDRYSRITLLGLFSHPHLKILEDKTLGLDAKIGRLTLMTFKDWAKAKVAK